VELHYLVFDIQIAVGDWVRVRILRRKHQSFKITGPKLDDTVIKINSHEPFILLGIYFLSYFINNFRATITKANVFL
jgi:hypothetical protein